MRARRTLRILLLMMVGLLWVGCASEDTPNQAGAKMACATCASGEACAACEAKKGAKPVTAADMSKQYDFTLQNYDGQNVSLSDYPGKIIVLEWINPQCPFVKPHYEAKRTMVDLAGKYDDKNVVWLAVNSSHFADNSSNADLARKWDIPYPVLNDQSGEIGRMFGARTTPHMFVLNEKRELIYQGAIDSKPMAQNDDGVTNYVAVALDSHLAGSTVATPVTKSYGCSVKYK